MQKDYPRFGVLRNTLLILLLGLFNWPVYAQQRPQFTQYIFNSYLINPAVSGIENYIDFKAGYRAQWTGLEGAPVTNYFSVHAPLGKEFLSGDATSFGGQDNNPMSRSYTRNYVAAAPHHGIGMHGVIDKAGPINRIDLNATYAYHLGLSNRLNLAVGVAAGISQINLNMDKVSLGEEIDPAIVGTENNRFSPDLGLGIWVYSSSYFIGLSAQQLLGKPYGFTRDAQYRETKPVPHYYFTAGYKVLAGEGFALIPSVMFKKVVPSPLTYDVNLKLAFRDKFWMGGSYRHGDALSAMAGFNISHLFNLSYSYDFTTSDLSNVSNGTHEVVLGLLLNNKYKVTCPQRSW